jgi:hypothetical protein
VILALDSIKRDIMSIENVTVKRSWYYWLLMVPLVCALAIGWRSSRSTEPAQSAAPASITDTSDDPGTTSQDDAPKSMVPAVPPPVAKEAPTEKPSGAPEIESPEVIATMDLDFVEDEVKRMDQELLDRKAVERLNSGEATDAERLEFGAMMHRIALFRHRLIEQSVESLQQEVEAYGKGHAERLAKYTKRVARR